MFPHAKSADTSKPVEDTHKKLDSKPLSVSVTKEKPNLQETSIEKPKLFSNSDEEYVLVTGPIYIPKSLLQHSTASEKTDYSRGPSITYSMLHNRADSIKHAVSYSSEGRFDRSDMVKGQDGLVINSQLFKTPPKVLQLRNVRDGERIGISPRDSGAFANKESVLMNE